MSQNFHTNNITPPSKKLPVVLSKILLVYKDWQVNVKNISKINRYSIGLQISNNFISMVENVYKAFNTKNHVYVRQAILDNDLIKFHLHLLFEMKELGNDEFIDYSIKLDEIGKILYGWQNKKPPYNKEVKN